MTVNETARAKVAEKIEAAVRAYRGYLNSKDEGRVDIEYVCGPDVASEWIAEAIEDAVDGGLDIKTAAHRIILTFFKKIASGK